MPTRVADAARQRGAGRASSRPQYVRIGAEYGDDADADFGDQWQPFRTWEAASAALGDPVTGPNALVPTVIEFDGSANSASPTATYTKATKQQISTYWVIRPTGALFSGGDADRSRAGVLLTPTASGGFAGPLIEVMGRYAEVSGVCLSNPHASGVGLGIGTTSLGGGFQGFRSFDLQAFGCGLAGIRVCTFNTDGLYLNGTQAQNNPGFGILFDDQAGAVDLPNQCFLVDVDTSNNATNSANLPSPFTNKGAHVAVLGAMPSPAAAGEGLYIDGWKSHGLITRYRCEGGHNMHASGLYWENNNDQAVDTPQIVIRKGTGTGGTAPTHYAYVQEFLSGRVHGLTHSGWTAGKALWADIDECVDFKLHTEVEFHQTDCAAANPLITWGSGTSMAQFDFGVVTSTGNRANRVTTAAALAVIGASAVNHGTYFDGAVWPQTLP